MRSERVFDDFSALPFDEKVVTGKSVPAWDGLQPRLMPGSIQDFDVRQTGSADAIAPQPGHPGAARRWSEPKKLIVEFLGAAGGWAPLRVRSGGSILHHPGNNQD